MTDSILTVYSHAKEGLARPRAFQTGLRRGSCKAVHQRDRTGFISQSDTGHCVFSNWILGLREAGRSIDSDYQGNESVS